MQKFDKRTAVRLHREMWTILSQDGSRDKESVLKNEQADAVWEYGHPRVGCWLCQYSENEWILDREFDYPMCRYCPLDWGSDMCCDYSGAYSNWENAQGSGNFDLATKIAGRIAALPEKEVTR
jgi:hypothetical protein